MSVDGMNVPVDLPPGGFYAQLDKIDAIQDYAPGRRCARFVGISPSDFSSSAFLGESGCQTYILDVSSKVLAKAMRFPAFNPIPNRALPDGAFDVLEDFWFYIKIEPSTEITDSYAYPAFTEASASYFNVMTVQIVGGLKLPLLEASHPEHKVVRASRATLSAFHVGQGMCSLYSYGDQRYLLDAGAGTPIKREVYRRRRFQDGTPFINELRTALGENEVIVIISHADSDHWRLLEWDLDLLNQAKVIYFPMGVTNLISRSKQLMGKLQALADHTFRFDSVNALSVYRTSRANTDNNGSALVAEAKCNGRNALVPGDYVYERIKSDSGADLAALAHQAYHAVVVPHHGDSASSREVPTAQKSAGPIAFFSAGTHPTYRHPRQVSLDAHTLAGYQVVNNPGCPHILRHPLL
ncbi:hypothetical protein [Pseudomonas sp. RW3S2]|uniref:hypothetical protein n=1 Tax=Pseudomonas sp. RW3S2 TaxID=485884 RepID=UPI001645014C|nr:hypothetical protein [Pseudomonas sp. RW3S2]MBC3420421.1 hypothetical protein [Pseudomonas sp. RW3S2]